MAPLANNLTAVRARVDAACAKAGRQPSEVRLMAVSKTHAADLVREAHAAGCLLFGENKVQEVVGKAEELTDLTDLRWAFVGHLQTNKAKDVARVAHEFHALDSLKLARALDQRLQDADRQLDVYIEVNSSAEPAKFGLAPEEVEDFASELTAFPALQVKGLMTLAVNSSEEADVRACFARMQELQARLRGADSVAGTYDELSMGMSGDFELAIAHGATTVRVGQAIFGAREL